jgi:hypothetical protein
LKAYDGNFSDGVEEAGKDGKYAENQSTRVM